MMPFIEINGLPGKVYVPEALPTHCKKHKCADCFSCQMCSDTRCRVCTNNHHATKTHNRTCGKPDNETDNEK